MGITSQHSRAPESTPSFDGVRVAQSLVFCVLFCGSLFVLFFWPLSCLSFFDLHILIAPLVSSNSSFSNLLNCVVCLSWIISPYVKQYDIFRSSSTNCNKIFASMILSPFLNLKTKNIWKSTEWSWIAHQNTDKTINILYNFYKC